VLEVTRIRQEGFAWRPDFADFARRYKIIAFPVTELDNVPLTSESCEKIIKV
jgi:myosin heavy subunit